MKRIIGAALAAMLAVFMTGCGSTAVGSSSQTSAANQNRANNDPDWLGMGTFTSRELKNAPEDSRVWKGYVEEDGMFFTGESNFGDRRTATSTAELNAKAQIAQNVEQVIADFVKDEREKNGADSSENENFSSGTATAVAKKISGIRRVDRYIAEDGYTHVLMFVSNSDIQKAAKDTSMSAYEKKLMERVFPVSVNSAATVSE